MSVELMSRVFKLAALPPNPKLVALKFADHSDDDGLSCYPSIGRVAREASLSTRTVERIVAKFRKEGILAPLDMRCGGRGKRGRGVSYRFNIERAEQLYKKRSDVAAETSQLGNQETPDRMADISKPPTAEAETPDTQNENLRHQVADKPSIEPSDKPSGPPLVVPPRRDGALFAEPDKEHDHVKQTRRGTRLDPDWRPSSEAWDLGRSLGLSDAEIADQLDRFRDYWIAKPGKDGRKLDWHRTFQNWLRRSADDRGRGQGDPRRRHAGGNRTGVASVVAAVNRIHD